MSLNELVWSKAVLFVNVQSEKHQNGHSVPGQSLVVHLFAILRTIKAIFLSCATFGSLLL